MNVVYYFEQETGFEIKKQKNGMYEWGFDLTDFNDHTEEEYTDSEEEHTGTYRFKEFLDKFKLYYKEQSEEGGFVWSNTEESVVMVTANNPITGEYCTPEFREPEKGYLGYVGISCKSTQVLQEFIRQFRIKATFIKEESNGRLYI